MMKRKSMLAAVLLVTALAARGQRLENSTDYTTGYIVTSGYDESNTIRAIDGVLYMIYDDLPMVLVKYPPMKQDETFEVPSSVRRICNNAFQGTKYLKTLRLHSTVTDGRFLNLTIGERAFDDSSIEAFEVVESSSAAPTGVAKSASADRKEVGRYDAAGRKVGEGSNGVHIVVYDDHTSKKAIE